MIEVKMPLEDEKQSVIERIDRVRDRLKAVIDGVDPDALIHQESGWRLRDVLAHIVAWQHEAIAAGKAHISGQPELPIPNMDRFNQEAYEAWKGRDYQEIYAAWLAVYEELKEIVQRAPADRWNVEFTNSWSFRGTLAQHIQSILAHDIEHREEIEGALAAHGG
jgi:hypothetical protein